MSTGPLPDISPRFALLVLASVALNACGGGPGNESVLLDDLPLLNTREVSRIGDFDDPDVGFSRIAGVDIDRDGNVFVIEGMVPEIRVYSPAGELIRRIGGRGSGPGEFESPPRFGILGDTVWTVEGRRNRIALFDRQGTILATGAARAVLVDLPDSFGHLRPWIMRGDGMFISYMGMIGSRRDAPPSEVEPTDSIPVPFVLFDPTGAVVDTIGWTDKPPPSMWRPPSEWDMEIRSIQVDGETQFVPTPPSRLPDWEPMTDGYLIVEAPEPTGPEDAVLTVTRMGLHGDTIFHSTHRYEPARYTDEVLDSIAAKGARGEPDGMLPFFTPGAPVPDNWRAIANALRPEMDFPEFIMPIQYTWPARDGSLWLRWQDPSDDTGRWVLIDQEGRAVGTLALPKNVQPWWSSGDTFWASVPDEYDVPWLVQYRILR